MKQKKPLQAATISVGHCGCPNIHIMLHDRDGNVIAQASMSSETAASFAEDIRENVEAAIGGIGRCVGHA